MEELINKLKEEYLSVKTPEALDTSGLSDMWSRVDRRQKPHRFIFPKYLAASAFILIVILSGVTYVTATSSPKSPLFMVKKLSNSTLKEFEKFIPKTLPSTNKTSPKKSPTVLPSPSSTPTLTPTPARKDDRKNSASTEHENATQNFSAEHKNNESSKDVKGASTTSQEKNNNSNSQDKKSDNQNASHSQSEEQHGNQSSHANDNVSKNSEKEDK